MTNDRIGVFGGSFSPFHNGHINSALTITKALALKKIMIMPSFQTPGKESPISPTPRQRFEMCQLAAEDYDVLDVSPIEFERGGISYTIDTLKELNKTIAPENLFLIVGLDSFYTFDTWKNFGEILERANIVVTSRPGSRFPDGADKFPKGLQKYVSAFDFNYVQLSTGRSLEFVKLQDMDISGTEIRRMIRSGKNVDRFVSIKVEDYIRKNHLYDPAEGKVADFEEFTRFCAQQLIDKKASNVQAFDLEGLNKPSDFSLVASGTSTKHAQSLAENLAKAVKDRYGLNALSREGETEGRWVLLDYGALIVHVFYDFVREEFRLEDLWKGAKRLEIRE